MSNATRLFYDLVSDPIYDKIDWMTEYDSPYVYGKMEATDEILAGLEPFATLLLELWRELANGNVEYTGGGTLHQTLEVLPPAIMELLDNLTWRKTST